MTQPRSMDTLRENKIKTHKPGAEIHLKLLEDPQTQHLYVDAREHLNTDRFTGYTRRGLRMSLATFFDLSDAFNSLAAELNARGFHPKIKEQRHSLEPHPTHRRRR